MSDNDFEEMIYYPARLNYYGNLDCPYNKSINCDDKSECKHCGWNPAEDARRRVKTREKLIKKGWLK